MVTDALERALANLLTTTVALGLAAGTAGACTSSDAASPGAAPLGLAPSAGTTDSTPTWYRDVEPIVQRECAGCHVSDGTGGFPLDRVSAKSLASLMAERVAFRDMPPWPPGRAGAPIAGARVLGSDAIATLAAWAIAGGPDGDPRDHVERAPRISPVPPRPADLHIDVGAGESYQPPASPFVTDEVRCFVLELPTGTDGLWVNAARWRAGTPRSVHNLGGVVVGPQAASEARARSRRDGRPGFECGGGLGELASGPMLGANGTGGGGEGATFSPVGTAVRVPSGGAILMRVHYAIKHLSGAVDRSGVDLWLTEESQRQIVRPIVNIMVAAPVEVPCPSGVSNDPASPCNRENAFARLAGAGAAAARGRADARLTTCDTELARATQATASGDHFFVKTACASVAPWDGTVHVVLGRMQTRGASLFVEVEQPDGSWSAALDIPRWRWAWEGAYVLEQGLPVRAGRHFRVSCTFDNGAANQWSALTGEPGHDAPARPPLLAPAYIVAAPNRAAEACEAHLGIERAPYRGMAWPTLCHEAQAVHDDACGAGLDLVSRGCTPLDLDTSVAILQATSPQTLCGLP